MEGRGGEPLLRAAALLIRRTNLINRVASREIARVNADRSNMTNRRGSSCIYDVLV